jgi:hypothetical protein
MRRLLIGLLFLALASMLAGALWLVTLGLRGETDSSSVVAAMRLARTVLCVGGAVICALAVTLQLTRRPTEGWDWTLTASIGAGACLYTLGAGDLVPQQWSDALPGSLSLLVPLVVLVAVAYVVFRRFLHGGPRSTVVR